MRFQRERERKKKIGAKKKPSTFIYYIAYTVPGTLRNLSSKPRKYCSVFHILCGGFNFAPHTPIVLSFNITQISIHNTHVIKILRLCCFFLKKLYHSLFTYYNI